MLGWLRKLVGAPARAVRVIRARYDAAQSAEEDARHWAWADALSAAAANSLDVRKRIRERARYETANNGYARGATLSIANDALGTGPRLQIDRAAAGAAAADQIEAAWGDWCEAVGLTAKLHTAWLSYVVDGEAFALLTTNPALPTSVQLDVRLIECDQVTTPGMLATGQVDGLEVDASGNVTAYHLLSAHPGDTLAVVTPYQYARVPARRMVHWFRADRPGQVRGVSHLTPALKLFAQLRRYTLAVLTAAEVAASFAATLESQAPPDGTTDDPTPFETLSIERGMMTVTPAGWKMNQFRPEQPQTTYEMFKREILKEIGRPINAPYNVIAGDSSPYNYSSAKMDRGNYLSHLAVERDRCRALVLERVFAEWLQEATRIPGLLPPGTPAVGLRHSWYWPAPESLDPEKDARADTERLANGTTTLTEILAGYGQSRDVFLRTRAEELRQIKELGLPLPAWAGAAPEQTPAPATPAPAEVPANA